MTDAEYEDPFGAELGAFDIVADSSAATARQQRIEAARKAARSYQAKVEEPGVRPSPLLSFLWARTKLTAVVRVDQWYNSLDPTARAKDLARLVLYSLHDKYYDRRFLEVVDAGCELIAGEVKEQSEVIDLVLRAAAKCDIEVQRRKQVLDLARRWREYVSRGVHSHAILHFGKHKRLISRTRFATFLDAAASCIAFARLGPYPVRQFTTRLRRRCCREPQRRPAGVFR